MLPLINANGDRGQRPFDNGHGWDIRLAVPGDPGNDYPTLNSIPRTSFTCSGKDPGYYADREANCQVFRVCTLGSTYGFQSFICPNGTLFNQEVFVCDWWMNVNCQKSKKNINNNINKLGNLKLGHQFMNDVKKMITHPMRNPYDRSYVKSNLIYMQVYKPPSGQLNNDLVGRLEQNTNDIFVNKNLLATDIAFAASTPSTQYIPNYIFQNQIQKRPYSQLNSLDNLQNRQSSLVSNAHSGQSSQIKSQDIVKKQNNEIHSSPDYQHINTPFNINNSNHINKSKQTVFGLEISKQQINNEKQSNTHGHTRFLNDNTAQVETKQNLVSKDSPPKLITKTLAFRKIITDPKSGTPKSRITFKTWIVRPSKSAKLKDESHLSNNNDVNNYNEKLSGQNLKSNTDSYKYHAPAVSYKENISSVKNSLHFISSTTPSSIFSSQSTRLPTKESQIYVAPTTLNPLSFTYLPPSTYNQQISRQYLLPDISTDRLAVAGSSPTPFYQVPLNKDIDDISFLSKESLVNGIHNNLSFSDILTKEKLDISVNDIVKDTNSVIQTASPELLTQFDEDIQPTNSPVGNYLPPEINPHSGEKLILQPPSPLPKSSRLVATPSTILEPPYENVSHNFKLTSNKLSNLPYIKESPLQRNTIERMVSLKITLPENIAKYLFKNHYGKETNNLEIINTENSDYLVLTNKLSENGGTNIIPIGKIIKSKNTKDFSDSQDLVFSFLADSINKAKEYNSIAQQNILTSTTTQPQFQNLNNYKSQQISHGALQVTPTQVTRTNFSDYYRSSNIIKTSTDNTVRGDASYYRNSTSTQNHHSKPSHQNISPSQTGTQNQKYSINSDKIYSGQLYQLPVPIVTKQIYNSPIPSISNYILSTKLLPTNQEFDTKQKYNQRNKYNHIKQSYDNIEIIPSQIIPTTISQAVTQQNLVKTDQGTAANGYIENFGIPTHGIRAQVKDSISGTFSHPIDQNKLIKYKKNHSYYVYSNTNNNYKAHKETIGNNANTIDANQASKEIDINSPLTYQVVPSLGYKLEDEKEKQFFLNLFQIGDLENPKQNALYSQRNANIKRKQDISADVEYTVKHPTSPINAKSSSYISALYDGPSSYLAPQSSVNSLEVTQNIQSDSKYNSKIEKFDTFDNEKGYPRMRPIKTFEF